MARLFSIEGIDCVGKTTQVLLLRDALHDAGQLVADFKFPDDDSQIGRLLKKILRSSHKAMPAHALFALFAANRLEHRELIIRAKSDRLTVVFDRYSESEYAYGQASNIPAEWLFALESQMPTADLVFLLDMDPRSASARGVSRGKLDSFELDLPFQTRVRENYLRLAKQPLVPNQQWIVLNAELPPMELHKNIFMNVMDLLSRDTR